MSYMVIVATLQWANKIHAVGLFVVLNGWSGARFGNWNIINHVFFLLFFWYFQN